MARAYRAWALFTAPVAAWCVIELVLRLVTGETAGLGTAVILGACAAGSGWVAAWRARSMPPAP